MRRVWRPPAIERGHPRSRDLAPQAPRGLPGQEASQRPLLGPARLRDRLGAQQSHVR